MFRATIVRTITIIPLPRPSDSPIPFCEYSNDSVAAYDAPLFPFFPGLASRLCSPLLAAQHSDLSRLLASFSVPVISSSASRPHECLLTFFELLSLLVFRHEPNHLERRLDRSHVLDLLWMDVH